MYSDQYENIIYAGKAKSLKKRVASYFSSAEARDERLEDLLPCIADVSYQGCGSELDSLILEYLLIKKYKPCINT